MSKRYQVVGVAEEDLFLGFGVETVVREIEKGVLYSFKRYSEHLNKAILADSQRSFPARTLDDACDVLGEKWGCYDVYWEEIKSLY